MGRNDDVDEMNKEYIIITQRILGRRKFLISKALIQGNTLGSNGTLCPKVSFFTSFECVLVIFVIV